MDQSTAFSCGHILLGKKVNRAIYDLIWFTFIATSDSLNLLLKEIVKVFLGPTYKTSL